MEPALPSNEPVTMVDSLTGDTIKVIRQVDTIVNRERETCVWVRDIFGQPQLQCYDSYYSRSWLFYNNTPWWYRNDPYWYDYNRCPRYYSYDPSCGCCRYYDGFQHRSYGHYKGNHYNNHHHSGGSPQSGSSGSHGSSGGQKSSSSGAPITGSSSRTSAQKAPPSPVQQQPSGGGSVQKSYEPPPSQPQSTPPSPTADSDQGTTKQRISDPQGQITMKKTIF